MSKKKDKPAKHVEFSIQVWLNEDTDHAQVAVELARFVDALQRYGNTGRTIVNCKNWN